jgi:hypothetical protein
MFWKEPVTLHVCGWLIDFDMASLASDDTIRTGTELFMARAPWERIPWVYEYDVESFFWVAMWVVFCSGDKPLAPNFPLLKWGTMDNWPFWRYRTDLLEWLALLDSKLDTLWEPWSPLYLTVFRTPYSPTDDPDTLYPQLLMAQLEGEQSLFDTEA